VTSSSTRKLEGKSPRLALGWLAKLRIIYFEKSGKNLAKSGEIFISKEVQNLVDSNFLVYCKLTIVTTKNIYLRCLFDKLSKIVLAFNF
jgi:hypothetical protein